MNLVVFGYIFQLSSEGSSHGFEFHHRQGKTEIVNED